MTIYILQRLIQTVIVVILISFISFGLLQVMPGDPAAAVLGPNGTPAQIEALRQELGLDQPVLQQYFHWVNQILHGDFGTSLQFREPASTLFADRLQVTLYLSLISMVVSTVLGITVGVLCAMDRGGIIDQFLSVLSNIGIAIPIFWLGIVGIYFFSFKFSLLPFVGWVSPFSDFVGSIRYTILPVILLAIPGIAIMARQTRSSMLEVTRQDYMRTAYSKGLTVNKVLLKHGLKNALIPVVTMLGLQVRILVGGSVLVENVFGIPGMGRLLVGAAQNKDFILVQGGVLLIGIIVCLSNLLVDMSYGWIDPRIRLG